MTHAPFSTTAPPPALQPTAPGMRDQLSHLYETEGPEGLLKVLPPGFPKPWRCGCSYEDIVCILVLTIAIAVLLDML